MREHAAVVVLEAELEDAVVGDGQRQRKGEAAGPAVHRVDPRRLPPRELAEDPRGRQELEAGEDDHSRRQAGLEMDRVAEEEPEVALRTRVVRRKQAGRQREEREGDERRDEPAGRPRGRGGGDLCHGTIEQQRHGQGKPLRRALARVARSDGALHHSPGAARDCRHGRLYPLAGLGGGHGDARARRQRLRRGRRGGVRPAGGPAPPETGPRAGGGVVRVVEPHLNGPGGEVPILLYSAERDEVLVVDGQGPAPAAASIERYRERGLELVPGTGLLAACVPGAFDAWLLLQRDFGTLPLADVLEPALGYAEGGYPLVPAISRSIAKMERVFRYDWPGSAELYLPVPEPGARFRNPDLAATYRRVLAESGGEIDAARDAFYRGFVAEAIVDFLRGTDALLSGDDLAPW